MNETAVITETKINGNGSSLSSKSLSEAGKVKKPSTTPMSNTKTNVVQVPQWVITAFGIPTLLFIVWFTQFYTSTTYQLNDLKESNNENYKLIKLQDAWLRETRELMIKKGIPAEDVKPLPDITQKGK